ncbi:retinoid-inducible serine carboxypeptidase isoform X2 [Hemicordylus capensis]|uniref:retinoid-inducible serine carboxypeptidase isoform X2 n=1 Tax=Hemicordylus capensis TaxID=884348 RepID=UPI002304376C|nr:retinoid-inducible serine carboxypeptidase isoform X2 [Hemicordylus capensis]
MCLSNKQLTRRWSHMISTWGNHHILAEMLPKQHAVVLFSLVALSAGVLIKEPREPKQAWDYVPVRSNASMFWWLYYANSPTQNFTELPLILWLQGGPGASGCGFGNFEEIGPLDSNLKPRRTTWLQSASLLFVDNPVGTGYSYVNDSSAYTTDLCAITSDMMVLLQKFFCSKTEFQTIPFYIFSESYGGKMAAGIALELHKAIQAGKIKCNFRGVALGDSWISPLDSVLAWGPYLYSTSFLDDRGLREVTTVAKKILDAVDKSEFKQATSLWSEAEEIIEKNTNGVNFYNILTPDTSSSTALTSTATTDTVPFLNLFQRHVQRQSEDKLSDLMNGPIRKKLKIIPDHVKWGGQAQDVFSHMTEDFMKHAIDIVDDLLAANINVTVYNGQLDLIVPTMGQEAWLRKLKWPKLKAFCARKWDALYACPNSTQTSAFHKSYDNLDFFWILMAGHMIPADQGDMALKMMKMVTHQSH